MSIEKVVAPMTDSPPTKRPRLPVPPERRIALDSAADRALMRHTVCKRLRTLHAEEIKALHEVHAADLRALREEHAADLRAIHTSWREELRKVEERDQLSRRTIITLLDTHHPSPNP